MPFIPLLFLLNLRQSAAAFCALGNDDSMNVFVSMPTESGDRQLASIESVFYNYPDARVVIVGQLSHLVRILKSQDDIRNRGYCLLTYDVGSSNDIQAVIYQLQAEYGGLFMPSTGILLNTLSHITRHLSVNSDIPIFQEALHFGTAYEALSVDELSEYIWKRPETDFLANSTFICAVHCMRFIPKGSQVPYLILSAMRAHIHPDATATAVLRTHVKRIVILPFWLTTESRFPDHWAKYGNRPGFTDRSTDLYSPRPKRFRQDYWHVISRKLWLPLDQAILQETNVFRLSVVGLVLQEFSLNLCTPPFKPVGDQSSGKPFDDIGIKTPIDQVRRLMSEEQIALERNFHQTIDIGISGPLGSYRTFRHLRIIGGSVTALVHVEINANQRPSVGFRVAESQNYRTSLQICGTFSETNTLLGKINVNGDDDQVKVVITATLTK